MKQEKDFVSPVRVNPNDVCEHWRLSTGNPADAPIPVEVHNETDAGGGPSWFRAQANHPLLNNVYWQDTDLERLKRTISEELVEILGTHDEEAWVPAFVVRTRGVSRVAEASSHIGFDVAISSTKVARGTNDTNTHHHITNSDGFVSVLVEQNAHHPLKPEGGTHLKSDRMSEANRSVLLLEANEDAFIALQKIAGTLHLFGEDLTDALAPDADGSRTLPDTWELVEMMRRAAEKIETRVLPE